MTNRGILRLEFGFTSPRAVGNRKAGLTKVGKQADIVVEVALTRCGVVLGFLESSLQTCHSALQFCRLPALASERQNSFFPDGSQELVSPRIFSEFAGFYVGRREWFEAVSTDGRRVVRPVIIDLRDSVSRVSPLQARFVGIGGERMQSDEKPLPQL